MNMQKKPASSWLERIEDIVHVLEGSTVGEIELTEGETEIIIRRSPGLVLTASAQQGGTRTGQSDLHISPRPIDENFVFHSCKSTAIIRSAPPARVLRLVSSATPLLPERHSANSYRCPRKCAAVPQRSPRLP